MIPIIAQKTNSKEYCQAMPDLQKQLRVSANENWGNYQLYCINCAYALKRFVEVINYITKNTRMR